MHTSPSTQQASAGGPVQVMKATGRLKCVRQYLAVLPKSGPSSPVCRQAPEPQQRRPMPCSQTHKVRELCCAGGAGGPTGASDMAGLGASNHKVACSLRGAH